MGKGITFVDGDGVGDTITGVQDDTGGTTGSVQGQDGLDGDVHGRAVEGFEHDLDKEKFIIIFLRLGQLSFAAVVVKSCE